MRIYVSRVKKLPRLSKTAGALDKAANFITNPGLMKEAERMIAKAKRIAKDMTDFHVYKIARRKRSRAKKELVATLFPPDYKKIERAYETYQKYYPQRMTPPQKVKRNPYSRRNPHPPVPPQFINVQSGRLRRGFRFESRVSPTGRTVTVTMANPSMHFYFIVSSTAHGSQQRMMPRPFLEHFYSTVHTATEGVPSHMASTVRKEVYRRVAGGVV